MLYGLLNLSWWGYVIAILIMTQFTAASITIYLHRCQSHKSLDLHPIASHFFRLWLWLATGQETKQWVAIHRKHHAECETENDPHSPQIFGLKKVLLEGAELYREEGKNKETMTRYGMGTPDDWLERNVYSRHSGKGVVVMLILDLLLFGIPGITMWAIQMLWTPVLGAGVINGIGHFWGYRNYECNDASRNLTPIAFFIGGEELHNNHHTYPYSAKLSLKWWEFDIGWAYICMLRALGLAKVKRVPPTLKRVFGKSSIDAHTLGAFLRNRLVILSEYAKDVVSPVLREEKEKSPAKVDLSQAKKLLIRSESLIDEKEKSQLKKILDHYHPLQQVYQYRLRLHAIWDSTSANQKEMVEALQEWCKQAESTGIQALKAFAAKLKTFEMPQTA
jgi:stearoyl-CoA desaturase (delta-9 desaturase)